MSDKVTIPDLHAMKRNGEKIVGCVVWDYQMARIVDKVGVEIMSVGDTVGHNLWGQPNPLEVSVDEMLTVVRAVRRGTERAILSCDFPYGPLQQGVDEAVRAGIRFVKEAGVDMIKLDGAADYPEAVTALTRAGIPVWAQFGITPQTALAYGIPYASMSEPGREVPREMRERLVSEARMLEDAGAVLLDFTNSGPDVGPNVVESVAIPVIGGFGGGPWLDGRVRMAHAAIGYGAKYLQDDIDTYANVAEISFRAISELCGDIRAGRQIKGAKPRKS
ncbi:MAG TPA: 3-methyl-2-oxobutanoate hydroxymethyltransferase [Woeseiaceae bacterium]|nr:3-methyl-2-oxobutanoate hydroxymethyltransferase [Woeseiaceae bacterium]